MREVIYFRFQVLAEGAVRIISGKGTNQYEGEVDAKIKYMRRSGIKSESIEFQQILLRKPTDVWV
ncbi:hypothetical protein [Brevibacillus reuszeri]|uniref:hypothetical protein n=1 Tax=Brevibacillus reuszeri TaxID=54915 RepID=UPI000CCC282F|nr:hypothetical protein [Brevibacillus reuszeri]